MVNSSRISKGGSAKLSEIKSLMEQFTDAVLTIEGHASSDGPTNFNQTLSEKRAKAEETSLRQIVREEIKEALIQAWPTQTSGITGLELPNDYRNQVPQK